MNCVVAVVVNDTEDGFPDSGAGESSLVLLCKLVMKKQNCGSFFAAARHLP